MGVIREVKTSLSNLKKYILPGKLNILSGKNMYPKKINQTTNGVYFIGRKLMISAISP